jgi:glyoxylase-like metal-dependent hydrolase (beta-lactamase superfamily II)
MTNDTATSGLTYAVRTAVRPGVTRDLPHGPDDLLWVANSATLVLGQRDAVLVDTFTSIQQNAELVEWVKSFDRNLTTIYITHGHGDHLFGIGQLLDAFPDAVAIGTAEIESDSHINAEPAFLEGFWEILFPGQIPPIMFPEVLNGDHFDLEGHRLEVVDTGHTDTAHSTSLWVPDLRLVIAGDVAYNDIHPYTAETTNESREHWAQANEMLKAFEPIAVIAGHKKPEASDDPIILDETAAYLRDFNDATASTSTALELYGLMLERYPRRANPGSLWGGAKVSKP